MMVRSHHLILVVVVASLVGCIGGGPERMFTKNGEDLIVRSGLLAVKNTSYIVRQEVWKLGSDVKVAEANIVFVAVGQDGKPVRVPESWRNRFLVNR